MTEYVHPSLANRKVHYWLEGGPHAICGQPDSPMLRCSRRPPKVTCLRCQRVLPQPGTPQYANLRQFMLSVRRRSPRKEEPTECLNSST